jgi:hypothetical protein
MSNVAMLSLFKVLVINVAFAVDYSKCSRFEDGVVYNPLAKLEKFNYAPTPSSFPLRNEKHVHNP